MMPYTPWSEIKARHDAKLRAQLTPWQYRLHRLRSFAIGRRLAFMWRFQGGVGTVVNLLQKLCRHDNCAIIRYVDSDDATVYHYLSICGFCGFYEVEDDDETYDEVFERVRELKRREDG